MITIGVFGDSFAQRESGERKPTDESWITHIEKRGYRIRTFGMGGTACWYSYKKFLENYKKFSHIVFVHTSSSRSNNLPDDLALFSNYYGREETIPSTGMFQFLSPERQQQLLTIIEAQKYTKDFELDKFIAQSVFNTVNAIAKNSDKQIINILPFNCDDQPIGVDISNRAGTCITDLLTVSNKEMPNLFKSGSVDPRDCHLSLENNAVLGEIVIESLTNQDTNVINCMKSERFVFSREITHRYYSMIGL